MAVIRGYSKADRESYYKNLFNNPFWMYLTALCLVFFLAANSFETYLMATAFLLLSVIIVFFAYFQNEFQLHNRVLKIFTHLEDEYTILPAMKLTDGYDNSCTSFIVISQKGIFNIKVLEFKGILKGNEADATWQYIDATNPYHIHETEIINPVTNLKKSHKVVETLLKNHHLDYLFIRSVFVVHNKHATIQSDTTIPVVKLKELNQYLHGHTERNNMHQLKELITLAILQGHQGKSCLKMYCPEC